VRWQVMRVDSVLIWGSPLCFAVQGNALRVWQNCFASIVNHQLMARRYFSFY
jgi:hypothetical protein